MNIVIKFENTPNAILGFLVTVNKDIYYVINDNLNQSSKDFIFEALSYYRKDGVGKITVADITKNSNAIKFAESRGMIFNDYERLYKCS